MEIQTPRLVLRDFCAEDAPVLHEIECDPRVTRYMLYDPHSPDQTKAYVEDALRQQSENPRHTYDFAIVLRGPHADEAPDSHRTLVGRCGLGIRRPEHREAMVWYVLHPAQWGRSYAVEAASALLGYAFTSLRLHRVWADCDPRNIASCRVAVRLGMKREGLLRENYFLKGEWCSTAAYGILENEWLPPTEFARS